MSVITSPLIACYGPRETQVMLKMLKYAIEQLDVLIRFFSILRTVTLIYEGIRKVEQVKEKVSLLILPVFAACQPYNVQVKVGV